jgi:hypothetical protein
VNNLKISKGQTLVMEFQSVTPQVRHIDGKYPKDVYIYPVIFNGSQASFEVTGYLKSILEGRDGGLAVAVGKAYAISAIANGNRIDYEVAASADSPYTAPVGNAQPASAFGLSSQQVRDSDWYRDEVMMNFAFYYAKLADAGIDMNNDTLVEQAATFARGELITKLQGNIS